ncbi:MAG: hypothetical protein CTY28_14470 [Hyphomicrobium sp.]|nr:MAG: hypothetical protein CTY28_14470 [Hyphomicrobium sp.]
METGAQSIAGRLVRENVNDVLPGDTVSFSGKPRGYPALGEAASFPETVSPETDGPDYVRLPRDVARLLLLASDVLSEHWKTMVSATPQLTIVDLQVDTIDVLTEAGLVDPETGGVTEAFEAALAIAGSALGMPHAAKGGSGGAALAPVAVMPKACILHDGSRASPDDGEGIDQLAGANDDFEDDVKAAERLFDASPDPDWAGEPQPSILDALPRAGSFAAD